MVPTILMGNFPKLPEEVSEDLRLGLLLGLLGLGWILLLPLFTVGHPFLVKGRTVRV